MLVIRDFKRFCRRIASDSIISRNHDVVQGSIIGSLKLYGNGNDYTDDDNVFYPPEMMELKDFGILSVSVDTITRCIRDGVEWEVRCGKDVIGAGKKVPPKQESIKFEGCPTPFARKMLTMDSITRAKDVNAKFRNDIAEKFVKDVNDEHREEMRKKLQPEGEDEGDHEFILENVARDAANEARDMRLKFYAAKEENARLEGVCSNLRDRRKETSIFHCKEIKRLNDVSDNLQEQIAAEHKELRDAVVDSNSYMHVMVYAYGWSEIQDELQPLWKVYHVGIATQFDAIHALNFIGGMLDGLGAPGSSCEFSEMGEHGNCVTWSNHVDGISTTRYELVIEKAPKHIKEDDAVGECFIIEEFRSRLNRQTFVFGGPTS